MARLSSEVPGPLPGDVARVVAWLNAHLDEPIDLQVLAAVAGVPPRTLEAHFKRCLGTTPLGWVRQARLARARQQLLKGGPSASVTKIALASGFSQLGRFASHYRDLYGELPSQTLKRRAGAHGRTREIDDEAVFLSWRAVTAAIAVAPTECGNAIEDVTRAQALAPHYALPKAILAWCNSQRAAHNFDGPNVAHPQIVDLAEEAARLEPDDALTLTLASSALTLARRLDDADRLIERAIASAGTSPFPWIRRGWLSAYAGDSDNAIRELGIVMRLMPLEPLRHLALIGIGCAHFMAGRYDRAARWTREGVDACPGSFWAHRVSVAAVIHYGARDEGRRIARQLLGKEPNLTVAMARNAWPFPPDFVDRLCDGLQAAGVPRG